MAKRHSCIKFDDNIVKGVVKPSKKKLDTTFKSYGKERSLRKSNLHFFLEKRFNAIKKSCHQK